MISINRWTTVSLIMVAIVMPVFLLLHQRLERRTLDWKALAFAFLPLVVLVGFVALFFFLLRKPRLLFGRDYYRRSYRKQIGRDQSNVVAEFGQEALFISSENGVATHIPWRTIPRAVERPKGLFVYESDTVFRWFPKTAFASEAEFAAAIELMRSKVVKFEQMI